jgi:hypothetical protein
MKKTSSISEWSHPLINSNKDGLLALLLCYAISLSFYLSSIIEIIRQALFRGLWNDEIISIGILKQPFFDTMRAAYSGYDGMLPFFYLLSWPVVAWFPENDYAARWLQIIPAFMAPLLVFWWLSKRLSLASASIAVMPVVWFFSQYTQLAWHLRAYGFLFFATAGAIIALDVARQNRTKKWMILNATMQFLLVSVHPLGIFYCGILGIVRWLADILDQGIYFERKLIITYLPALAAVLVWLPAILASQKLVQPIPWQPATTFQTLHSILLPSMESLWPLVFVAVITIVLVCGQTKNSPQPLNVSIYLTLVPLGCLIGTLAVWAYSLQSPLYLDRYFSPNIWAWTIIIALAFQRLEALTNKTSRLAALLCALVFGLIVCGSLLNPNAHAITKKRIELTHVLLQGTRDDEIVNSSYPVFLFDFNVFMERNYYNPKSLDYRAVFDAAEEPPNPKKSLTERRIAEGMVVLGMKPEKLLTVKQAIETAIQAGGANVLGVKRTEETLAFLEGLKTQGFLIDSQQVNVEGNLLIRDLARLPK